MEEEIRESIVENKATTALSAIDKIEKYGAGYDFYLGGVKPVVEDCALAVPESRDKLLMRVSDRLRESGDDWRLQAMLIDLLFDLNEVGWRGVTEEEVKSEQVKEFEGILRKFLLPETAEKILKGDLRKFKAYDQFIFINPKREIPPGERLIVDMARKASGLAFSLPPPQEACQAFLDILKGDFRFFVIKECRKNEELGLTTAPDFVSCFLKISGLPTKEVDRQTLAKAFQEIWKDPAKREQFIPALENYRVYDDSRRGRYAELFPMVLEVGKRDSGIQSVGELGCSNFSALLDLVELFGEENLDRIVTADITPLGKHQISQKVKSWLDSGKMEYYQWDITKPIPIEFIKREESMKRGKVDLVTLLNVIVPHIENKIPALENTIWLSRKMFVISGGFYIEDYLYSGGYIFLHRPQGGIEVVAKEKTE